MAIDDEDYELDKDGNRVLFGLTVDETREFVELDTKITVANPFASMSSDEWLLPSEKRWLELYVKHQSAKQPFLAMVKTKH